MIPYVDTRIRAWVSWRTVAKPRTGAAGYYVYRTVLGDLRAEGSVSTGAAAPGSRTRAVTRDHEDREPLECELVVRHLPVAMAELLLLAYAGVRVLAELDTLPGPPRPFVTEQIMAALGICRATVYNRLHGVHIRLLDELIEPRLDGLVQHVMRDAALDTISALRQNTRHSAKVGTTTTAA